MITKCKQKEFNAIYELIISIAKIAAKFFKDEKPKADLFNYSKAIKAQNAPPKPKPKPVTP